MATKHIKNLKKKQFNTMKKIIIIGGSVIAVAALAYFGYKWYQNKKAAQALAGPLNLGVPASAPITVANSAPVNANVIPGSRS